MPRIHELRRGVETVFNILDTYYEGRIGNFIDTANNYQNEESETWVGECMEAAWKSRRDRPRHQILHLYLHWWDFATLNEEVMQSLNPLVVAGKVLYLGVSGTHGWGCHTTITGLALAYDILQKASFTFSIVGCRQVEHLESNIKALKVSLDEHDSRQIESITPFDLGFPIDFLFLPHETGPANLHMMNMAAHLDNVQAPEAIRPKLD
ncbi:hypothetical protein ASPACDRAFT_41060 [Aspergillus aculeatus ATCC 16872]|uniref:NADP-dependent oxidoreductase domain-containing protein n=1 Tax=Aspergillus aculeatus (strain ATCC 16872 / CBS 172.66 / WB 5094) TaxID=690307 RepID=A0A1L9X1B9_ASPA1|nr:uncharacterized protein ASPACDRAFT_41060 [Aspergillus aculeatus ATCC 16872]OJK02241.1 hypothetical protein ASPACDRAFT_41060 [Aspergillus aculeatus ATCC 16872]